MRGRWIPLSLPRRFMGDLLHFATRIPTVPVQRRMNLRAVAAARANALVSPSWPAVFLKAYAIVSDATPALRRAYLSAPWGHLREYPSTIGGIAVERMYEGEPCVFFGKISGLSRTPLGKIHAQVREFAEAPIESIKPFRKMLRFARLPKLLRRTLFWLGLNMARTRPGQLGTFGLSVYSSLGAESLHPLSPLTTTLTYGVIDRDGTVTVRLIYDHRVLDGATAARALAKLEEVLNNQILAELQALPSALRIAA